MSHKHKFQQQSFASEPTKVCNIRRTLSTYLMMHG